MQKEFKKILENLVEPQNLEEALKVTEEQNKKQEECSRKGHPGEELLGKSQFRGPPKALCYCKNCKATYQRGLNAKESEEWYKMLNRPIINITPNEQ